jgi:hypothetical protein
VKSRLAAGLLLGCLVAAAGCSSSSSSTASPATTAASPATTTASPAPKITARNFQVSTPNGQVSLSLDGQLPPDWPSQFPVPAGAKAAGSGSLGGSSSATLVAAYTTSQAASDAFAFYTGNSKLTTSDKNRWVPGRTTSGGRRSPHPTRARSPWSPTAAPPTSSSC